MFTTHKKTFQLNTSLRDNNKIFYGRVSSHLPEHHFQNIQIAQSTKNQEHMKSSLRMLPATILLAAALLSSCNTPAQKVENAQEAVIDAKQDLKQAREAYTLDIENYRKETAERIAANNRTIAAFNERIASQKKEAKEDYRKTIAELEQKNTDMKKRMEEYKEDGRENWDVFKAEFNRDMEKLGQAFKAFTVRNTN